MAYDFSLKAQIDYKILSVGPEAEPMILIDGLMQHPGSLVDYAAEDSEFGPGRASYPGIRAQTPAAYNRNLYGLIGPLLHKVFLIPAEQELGLHASFSMVVDPPSTLGHDQRVPHIDSTDPLSLSFVHYLCAPEFGGTAFFSHRATGWQTIGEERLLEYNQTLSRELNSRILPAQFAGDANPFFDTVGRIDARFDRIVVYRGRQLHSPGIAPNAHFSADPRQGRLTITAFLNPL